MAINECFVDPASGSDANGGASDGDAYQTVQKALDSYPGGPRASGKPDRINIKAGGTDTLSAVLDMTTYGNPTPTAFLILQGYSATEGDGGIGVISGGDAVSIMIETVRDHICWVDMDLGDCGNNDLMIGDNQWFLYNCHLHNIDGAGANLLQMDNGGLVMNCKFSDCERGVTVGNSMVMFCFFDDSGLQPTDAWLILLGTSMSVGYRNIVKLGTVAGEGIRSTSGSAMFINNSIFGTAPTEEGIVVAGSFAAVLNNIVSGFSGTGAEGFNLTLASRIFVYGSNHTHNCTTDYTIDPDQIVIDLGDNDTDDTTAPFTAPGTDDFSPVDVLNVKKGASAGSAPYDADGWFGI